MQIDDLKRYIEKELSEGKTEFRLVARNEDAETVIYMHPQDKDGETFDNRWKTGD